MTSSPTATFADSGNRKAPSGTNTEGLGKNVSCEAYKQKGEYTMPEKAKKSKRLEKALEIKIEDEIYEQMKNVIKEKMGGDVIG